MHANAAWVRSSSAAYAQVHEDLEGVSGGYTARQPPPHKILLLGSALTWEEAVRGSGEAA